MMREYSNDDLAFDRLADGELSAAERRALLETLDATPDGWRRCAIAFLEAQTWGGDFRELVRKPDGSQPVSRAPALGQVAKPRRPMRRAMGWAAMAASLLVAFSLGVAEHDNIFPVAGAPTDSLPQAQIADADAAPGPGAENSNDPEALTLWVRDEAGRPRSLRVPLMDAGALDRELGVQFQSGLPANVRQQLRDGGYQVQSKRRYAPLWLENGQRMVLPVEDTKIVPVSQNVY
ncbi:MAG: hypothetical protein L0228_12175 [Planctomycetes bacterium]|nr:hypothetical protein [Planctomycetota bacterium]